MIDEIVERCNPSSCTCDTECELKNRIVDEALDLWDTLGLDVATTWVMAHARAMENFKAA